MNRMSSRLARLAVSLCLLLGIVSHAAAQTIVVNRVDGTKVRFRLSDIASIDVNPTYYQPQADGEADGRGYVDLGLPSGTLWATMNVGAESETGYGDYFAWGETVGRQDGKVAYTWDTYQWCHSSGWSMMKYCTDRSMGTVDDKTELEPIDDAATMCWGEHWQMPSKDQLEELCSACDWTWTVRDGVNGYEILSRQNHHTLFLPAPGYRYEKQSSFVGGNGLYWSRTLSDGSSYYAAYLLFGYKDVSLDTRQRFHGLTVRAVVRK